ncbi:MAG: FmdB family zinc ribbon protein [bacterium]
MPTYDYKCNECGFSFEFFQKMSDKSLTECPKCKGKVKRLIGAGAGIIFKGSGFYETDYKKKSNNSNKSTIISPVNAKPADTTAKPTESKTETPITKAS